MAIPKCPYFGTCNGCSLQHLDYEVQLKNKQQLVARSLGFQEIKAFPSEPYNYRNRLDLMCSGSAIGLRSKQGAGKIVEIQECAIANEGVNRLIKEIQAHFGMICGRCREMHLPLGSIIVRATSLSNGILFVIQPEHRLSSQAVDEVRAFAAISSAENISVALCDPQDEGIPPESCFAVKGSQVLAETLCSKAYKFPITGFFQVNIQVAEKMQQYCHECLKSHNTKNTHLLDLYSGVGTFGIMNTGLFKGVAMLEADKAASECAEQNIRTNTASNVTAYSLDARSMGRLNLAAPLYIITDPPRSGMDEKVIALIKELMPESLLYISCNPGQLAKDVKKFRKYRIQSAAIFDMFPQTNHIETAVRLVLN